MYKAEDFKVYRKEEGGAIEYFLFVTHGGDWKMVRIHADRVDYAYSTTNGGLKDLDADTAWASRAALNYGLPRTEN